MRWMGRPSIGAKGIDPAWFVPWSDRALVAGSRTARSVCGLLNKKIM